MEPSIAASRVGCLYATVTALYALLSRGGLLFHGDDAEVESGQRDQMATPRGIRIWGWVELCRRRVTLPRVIAQPHGTESSSDAAESRPGDYISPSHGSV